MIEDDKKDEIIDIQEAADGGAVAELPDGRIMMVGTMSLGSDNQTKMALVKLSSGGKFE